MRNLSIVILLLLPVSSFQAATHLDIVINEIAWMRTEISSSDEWIELYNNTNAPVDLEGWTLKAVDGSPEVKLTNIIPAQSFYLLERTDEETIPNVLANQIYKGTMRNNGENLELSDNFGNLIDSTDCGSGWFAGNNSTKKTMERISPMLPGSRPDSWQTSQNPGGTPKEKNSIVIQAPLENDSLTGQAEPQSQTESEKPTAEEPTVDVRPQQLAQAPIIYPSGVVINEILPSPEGNDAEEEWIEIFNQNNFEVNLSGWQITDIMGSIKTYTFPEGSKISPQGFLVLPRPEIKITLNNDSDGLKLIQPSGKVIDEVIYQKAPQGQSYNKTESNWVWGSVLTPGSTNIISAPQPQKENEEKSEVGPLLKSKQNLATIGEQFPKTFGSLPIFLIALGLAIFSGIIILILKKKLKNASYMD